ncbi:Pisatin demethylase [Fusarium oxysporum f. sp. albedinis]|nr:Pisatin demethylase [Fusarium oxysporum f. sp. albedinis]
MLVCFSSSFFPSRHDRDACTSPSLCVSIVISFTMSCLTQDHPECDIPVMIPASCRFHGPSRSQLISR